MAIISIHKKIEFVAFINKIHHFEFWVRAEWKHHTFSLMHALTRRAEFVWAQWNSKTSLFSTDPSKEEH